VFLSWTTLALAQDPEPDKRAFGVLPNNRTAESSVPFAPISTKRKLTIAAKDSFALPVFFTASVFAGFYQLQNSNPSFGQGMAGYAKRYATAFGDQMSGNMLTEGFIPALGHQDPRYFRLGHGSKKARILNAVESIFVARMDSGRKTFNFSEWGGNAAAAAISNAYYPDSRTARQNTEKLFVQCGADALANVLKEFWPDVKRHFFDRGDPKP